MRVNPLARQLRQKQTQAEILLWNQLKNRQFNGIKFRRQHSIKGYIADFISFRPKIIIELDGWQHKQTDHLIGDEIRSRILEEEGYLILRFWNGEINHNLSSVLKRIEIIIGQTYPSPGLSHKGRGIQR